LIPNLEKLPGIQILVIASCYAGAFLALGDRSNCTVFAACAPDEVYTAGGTPPRSHFLFELLGAWCGVCFEGFPLPAREASLDAAFEAAERRLAENYKTTKPLRRGAAAWP
jgi:hypothetical protein